MKTISPFELDALERDWIAGVSKSVFKRLVRNYTVQIESVAELASRQGVLITDSNPVEFAAAYLASVRAGVPVILGNPNWQQSEWEQLEKQVNPAVVFGKSGISQIKVSKPNRLKSGTILIPTGGSSGKLKLAVHTWKTLSAACEGFLSFIGTSVFDSCCVLPLYHVSGLMQLMRSFVSDGRILFVNYRLLQNGQIPKIATENLCLSLVPTQLSRLISQKSTLDWLRSLKAIFLGGAPMPANLQKRVRELRLPLVLTYGMTETAAMITALPKSDFLSGKFGAGYALEHAQIQIVRENGSVCSTEETGRIQIQARSLCHGYNGGFPDDFSNGYQSQDEGYLDEEGCLHVIGRSDRIIISGGEKIDPLEIEVAFIETGMVDQVLAVGLPDAEWGEKLIVFCVFSNSADEVELLRLKLKNRLVNYKIPREIIPVDELPLTVQGKLDRAQFGNLLKGNEFTN